jgi:hypothetical protein
MHIRDDVLTADGRIDVKAIRPLARLGYVDYTVIDTMFEMAQSGPHAARNMSGLVGQARGKVEA